MPKPPPSPPAPQTDPGSDSLSHERQRLIENLAVLVVRQHHRLRHDACQDEPNSEQAVGRPPAVK
jgi:hypothetical protein